MAGKWHMGDQPQHFPAARGFERDLALIPGGGSHFDDMWGANGEKQRYTHNGQIINSLRKGFHSSEDYTNAIINNIEENRISGKLFLPISHCKRHMIHFICLKNGMTSTRIDIIKAMMLFGLHVSHECKKSVS
jgi:arylsulfatase A-like enzyme